jgi:hypothetical protein
MAGTVSLGATTIATTTVVAPAIITTTVVASSIIPAAIIPAVTVRVAPVRWDVRRIHADGLVCRIGLLGAEKKFGLARNVMGALVADRAAADDAGGRVGFAIRDAVREGGAAGGRGRRPARRHDAAHAGDEECCKEEEESSEVAPHGAPSVVALAERSATMSVLPA